uniref:Mannose-P-dolichol utilization defect 1 protein homolog n=1 Tax=Meloidogyne hapla TaxID=6305 RepID=A0A1I8B1V1_MELHA
MKMQLDNLVKRFLDYFMPGKCFDEFLAFNFFEGDCLPILISRILGVGITVGSSLLFVPQILKIYQAKSAEGISLASQLFGLVSCLQWGDSLFVSLQTVLIIMQILYYSNSGAFNAFVSGLFYFAGLMAVVYHYVPLKVLDGFQAATIPITFLSKSIQIWTNYSQKGTGQLSLISVFLQFAGCCARVFTSIQETNKDWLIMAPFILASILNGLIFVQMIYYSRTTKKDQKKKTR